MDDAGIDRRDRYVRGQVTRAQNVYSRDFSDERLDGTESDENEKNFEAEEYEREYLEKNYDRQRKIGQHLNRIDSGDISDESPSFQQNSYNDGKLTERKGKGPDVVVTMADVHLTPDELEDLDKLESYPNQFRHGNQGNKREVRSRSHDKKRDRPNADQTEGQGHLRRETRKYQSQSQQNLSNHGNAQESRPKVRHHYTPTLVRKGKDYSYELPVDIDFEGNNDEVYDYYGDLAKIPKATSVADIPRGAPQFTMPTSKMGSFQDFGPIKHSTSTLRVSSSKGNYFSLIHFKGFSHDRQAKF